MPKRQRFLAKAIARGLGRERIYRQHSDRNFIVEVIAGPSKPRLRLSGADRLDDPVMAECLASHGGGYCSGGNVEPRNEPSQQPTGFIVQTQLSATDRQIWARAYGGCRSRNSDM